jgi:hypothetical protein
VPKFNNFSEKIEPGNEFCITGGKRDKNAYIIINLNYWRIFGMAEYTVIKLPKSMSLSDRISEASKGISEWLKSLDTPLNENTDLIHLAGYKRNGTYIYQYIIERAVK